MGSNESSLYSPSAVVIGENDTMYIVDTGNNRLMKYETVTRTKSSYIDGNQLYDEILNYMPRLNKFIFCIHTHIMTDYSKKANCSSIKFRHSE
jgi:hypothetical protein